MPYKDPAKKKEAARRWRERNRDKERERLSKRLSSPEYKEYQRKYREANRDKAKQTSSSWRNNAGSDNIKNSVLKSMYGITLDDYNKMSENQLHTCAICKEPETAIRNGKKQKLAVDHCHKTGKVRGLLCWKCNTTLGRYGDDLYVWENFVIYLSSSLRESTE
jgi:translation initiation factor 2 beta subunit (eIF-2beta)/eIF-5